MLDSEKSYTKNELDRLPDKKTPSQLGREKALKERLDLIDDLKKLKGTKGNGIGDIDVVVEK